MSAFQLFRYSPLAHRPIPIGIREILFLQKAPCDFWAYQNDVFVILFGKNHQITRSRLKELIQKGIYQLFIEAQHIDLFKEALQQGLKRASRGLSVGNSIQNANNQISLLAINMGQLYRDPTDGPALDLQYNNAKNLIHFLLANQQQLPQLYREFEQKRFHYTIGHPMLSSLLLASFLHYLGHFSERNMEQLLLTNYFKDIGVSLIPRKLLDQKDPNIQQKKLLNKHSLYSVDILKRRLPLASNYLDIISNHHNHSFIQNEAAPLTSSTDLKSERENEKNDLQGEFANEIEIALVEMIDMITAIISPRPYRPKMTIFTALNEIKNHFSDNYQREFHHIVYFMQKFFARIK